MTCCCPAILGSIGVSDQQQPCPFPHQVVSDCRIDLCSGVSPCRFPDSGAAWEAHSLHRTVFAHRWCSPNVHSDPSWGSAVSCHLRTHSQALRCFHVCHASSFQRSQTASSYPLRCFHSWEAEIQLSVANRPSSAVVRGSRSRWRRSCRRFRRFASCELCG